MHWGLKFVRKKNAYCVRIFFVRAIPLATHFASLTYTTISVSYDQKNVYSFERNLKFANESNIITF